MQQPVLFCRSLPASDGFGCRGFRSGSQLSAKRLKPVGSIHGQLGLQPDQLGHQRVRVAFLAGAFQRGVDGLGRLLAMLHSTMPMVFIRTPRDKVPVWKRPDVNPVADAADEGGFCGSQALQDETRAV